MYNLFHHIGKYFKFNCIMLRVLNITAQQITTFFENCKCIKENFTYIIYIYLGLYNNKNV